MPENKSHSTSDSGGGGADISFRKSFIQGMNEAQEWGQIWKQISQLIKLAISLLVLPWLPIVRTRLGERRFGLTQRLMGLFSLMLMVDLTQSFFGLLVILLYLAGCFEHVLAVKRRRKRGERWHSYCQGVSRLMPTARRIPSFPGFQRVVVTPKDLDLYLDPLILFVPGLVLATAMANPFGWVMVLGGIALTIEQRGIYSRHHNLVLDQIDQMIVSEQLSTSLSGEGDIDQTEGFIVPGAASWSDQERQLVTASLSDLDPALKDILDPLPEDVSNTDAKISHPNTSGSANHDVVMTLN